MKTARCLLLTLLASCGPGPDVPPTVVNVYTGGDADRREVDAGTKDPPGDSGVVSDVSGYCPAGCGERQCCFELTRSCVDWGQWCGDGPEPLVCQSVDGVSFCAWCGIVGRPCCELDYTGLKFCHVGTCHGGQVCVGG